jgi:catechol 2,3-dioxygenase-like lactoylglutathione lyase family enzyme
MVHVVGLDHLVLRVADVERSLSWYCDRLGLSGERVDEWRAGRVPFPSVRVDPTTLIDLIAAGPSPAGAHVGAPSNLDHLCLVVEPVDLAGIAVGGGWDVVDGPGPRFGAQGMGTSLYVRDPDGNVVELRHYSSS